MFVDTYGGFLATTKSGRIRGHPKLTFRNSKFIEFLGVPYAQPPIGLLRFEDPKPVESWNGVFLANQSTICLQFNQTQLIGNEDCLHLNIYVNGDRIDPSKKRDVIVHIHPGVFTSGSGAKYSGPKYLMDYNVILVSMNYRLGLFGFLSTEDQNMPGNHGMKDQVMALTWIKENIQSFGGNPDSVTLTGAYSGAASVNFHAISPLSRGLFHKAIIASGSVFSPFNIQDGGSIKRTRFIAKNIGCNLKDTKELVACFKSRTALQIIEKMKKFRTWINDIFVPLALVIDKWSATPFLPEDPLLLLKNGNVSNIPYLISSEYSAGSWILNELKMESNYLDEFKNNWESRAPLLLHYEQSGSSNLNDVSDKIKKFYFGENNKMTDEKMIEILSDRFYLNGIDISTRLISKAITSSVFFYHFNYNARKGCSATNSSNIQYGSCHGKDMSLIFSNVDSPNELSEEDESMKDYLLHLWTTFIRTGRALRVNDWKPVGKNLSEDINLMYISNTYEQSLRFVSELGKRKFWSSLALNENYLEL